MPRKADPQIRDFILENIGVLPVTIGPVTAKKFGITRASVSRYMKNLLSEGLIIAEGNTRARIYKLAPLVNESIYLANDFLWTEDTVWREKIRPIMKGIKQNIIDLCQYGFTEMLNNVIDHSQSRDVFITYKQDFVEIQITIWDNGIGIFKKIQRDFELADARTALFELSKGKLTSDKTRHSGEGIYFTSRMFDAFSILSGHLYYSRERREGDDWLIETFDRPEEKVGTFVSMQISTKADWTRQQVFEQYQGDDIYFRKTHVPISLGRYPGEQLVSRSQAKRILARFTDFSEVILDFTGVSEIGQAFADEIFRVFKNEHPDTILMVHYANEKVLKMIRHVLGGHLPPMQDEK